MGSGEVAGWRCDRCGSDRSVGWRAGPAHEGFPLAAQCVPCGHVQDLPKPEAGWRSMDTAPRDGTRILGYWRGLGIPGFFAPVPEEREVWWDGGYWPAWVSAVDGQKTPMQDPDGWRPLVGTP